MFSRRHDSRYINVWQAPSCDVHSEDDSIGSSIVNRYTCSINAFGLKGFLSSIMFYCVKSHKKFNILDTFNELLCYCGVALRANIGKYQLLIFEFRLIPPKQPFKWTISINDIKKSSSTLHFEKFGKVQKFDKNTFFIRESCCKFQQFSRKQYKRAKAPIDLMWQIYLPATQIFKTA